MAAQNRPMTLQITIPTTFAVDMPAVVDCPNDARRAVEKHQRAEDATTDAEATKRR